MFSLQSRKSAKLVKLLMPIAYHSTFFVTLRVCRYFSQNLTGVVAPDYS
jgi:hypothetical protein